MRHSFLRLIDRALYTLVIALSLGVIFWMMTGILYFGFHIYMHEAAAISFVWTCALAWWFLL